MVIYQGIVSKYKTVPMKRFRVGQPSHRFRWRVALQNLLGNTECDLVEEKIELIDFLMIINSVNWQELLETVSPAHTMDGKTAMYTPSPPYAASQSKSGITGTSTLRRTSEISPSDCIRGEFKLITNKNMCFLRKACTVVVPHPETLTRNPAGGSNSAVGPGKAIGLAEGTLRSSGSVN